MKDGSDDPSHDEQMLHHGAASRYYHYWDVSLLPLLGRLATTTTGTSRYYHYWDVSLLPLLGRLWNSTETVTAAERVFPHPRIFVSNLDYKIIVFGNQGGAIELFLVPVSAPQLV